MSCEHAQTTTLLWLYGEAPDTHAAHIAACAECTRAVEMHEQVASALGPALPALRQAEAPPEPANRPWAAWMAAASFVAAAVALLLLWPGPTPEAPSAVADAGPDPSVEAAPPVQDTAVARARLPGLSPSTDQLDIALDSLDLELDALASDPSIL